MGSPAPERVCPSWIDPVKGGKAKLARELDAAPAEAIWPDVAVEYYSITDQLRAGGCRAVNEKIPAKR
jgi:hypothetical protein